MTKEQLDAIRARLDDGFPPPSSLDIALLLAEVERLTAERDVAKPNSRGLQKELREVKARHKEALDLCERYMGHLHKAEAERDAAFKRGVAAMREAAVAVASKRANLPKHSDLDSAWCRSAECILDELRHLPDPDPEDKP